MPQKTTSKERKKPKFRRGRLSHEKAVVCRGRLRPYVWELKKKKYKEES